MLHASKYPAKRQEKHRYCWMLELFCDVCSDECFIRQSLSCYLVPLTARDKTSKVEINAALEVGSCVVLGRSLHKC